MSLTIERALRKDKRTATHRKANGLQHRHFAFIAATLWDLKFDFIKEGDTASYEKWFAHVRHCADACAAGNPRFDRARFLRACGVTA
jgi:hypothetical protein